MASDYYCLPSLLDLALHSLCHPGHIPPTKELLPLPPHLKDGLRRRLTKRGMATGSQFAALVHSSVREVDLSDCSLTGKHLEALLDCPRLTKLNLNQPRPKGKPRTIVLLKPIYMERLLVSCPLLTVLYLRDCYTCVTDQVASSFPSGLIHLDLGGCSNLGDPGVHALSTQCPMLASLSLARTGVTDLGLSRLGIARCRNILQELKIDGCPHLTDLGVELLLEGLARLQVLSFHSCPGLTERSRAALELYLGQGRVRQLTWTVY